MEKTSAERTGLDVSDVIQKRLDYVRGKYVEGRTKVSSDLSEDEPWLLAWDIGEEEGRRLAKAFFKYAMITPGVLSE